MRTRAYGYFRIPDIIPVPDLEHGRLYLVDARSNGIGVWNALTGDIILSRFKFHPPTFLWSEPHWDLDKHHGTAQPYKALEERIPDISWLSDKRHTQIEARVLPWLEEMERKYKHELDE